MRNDEKLILKTIQEKITKMKNEAVNVKQKTNNISILNYKNDNSNLMLSNENNDSLTTDKNSLKDLQHFLVIEDSEQIKSNKNKYKKKEFLSLSDNFKINKMLTPTKKKPIKRIVIKNPSCSSDINNSLPKLNMHKKCYKRNDFYCIDGNFSFNNKYYSDLLSLLDNKNDNNISNEKNDMENVDIKIKKLAKDLKLFPNDKYDNDKSIYNGLNKNIDEGNDHLLPAIVSYENSPKSNNCPNAPPRLYSGIVLSESEKLVMKKNLNKLNTNKLNIKKLNVPSFLSNKHQIKGKEFSSLSQMKKDNFLYNNIFRNFDEKKYPSILKRYINNKINICYAENEKQFENRIIQMNENNRKMGKSVFFKLGKGEVENKADSLQSKVEFIRKIVDHAYSDIMICRIKKKNDMEIKIIKEKSSEKLRKERELKEKLKLQKYYKSFLLHDSIKIQKI